MLQKQLQKRQFKKQQNLIGNKIADKITSVLKKSNNNNNNNNEDAELTAHKKRYISPEERQQIINELKVVPKKDVYF